MATGSPNVGRAGNFDSVLPQGRRQERVRRQPVAEQRVEEESGVFHNRAFQVVAGAATAVCVAVGALAYKYTHGNDAPKKTNDTAAAKAPADPVDTTKILASAGDDPEYNQAVAQSSGSNEADEKNEQPAAQKIFADAMKRAGGKVVQLDANTQREAEAMGLCFAVYKQGSDDRLIFVAAREDDISHIEREYLDGNDPNELAKKYINEEKHIASALASLAEFVEKGGVKNPKHGFEIVAIFADKVRQKTGSERVYSRVLDKGLEIAGKPFLSASK